MKITIELPQDLKQGLICRAAQPNVSPQTLIIPALRQITSTPVLDSRGQ